MPSKIELQPAYLLHSRPWRDSSAILNFFTRDYGRVSAVGKGVRRSGSRMKSLLQPFVPLLISASGRSELKTLTHCETTGKHHFLQGNFLFSAFYLNELLMRMMHEHEENAEIFRLYTRTVLQLSLKNDLEPLLRSFEIDMLDALGYGFSFATEAGSDKHIEADGQYCLQPDFGFLKATGTEQDIQPGKVLLAIAERQFDSEDVRKQAKHLMRIKLAYHLGDKPLKSRNLFN